MGYFSLLPSKYYIFILCYSTGLKLTRDLKFSFIREILSGLNYLQSSVIAVHGGLNSKNCMVDARFHIKIGDFDQGSAPGRACPAANYGFWSENRWARSGLRKPGLQNHRVGRPGPVPIPDLDHTLFDNLNVKFNRAGATNPHERI